MDRTSANAFNKKLYFFQSSISTTRIYRYLPTYIYPSKSCFSDISTNALNKTKMSNELFHYLPYISSAMGSWPVEFIENKNLRKIYTGYKFVLNMNVILFNLSLLMEIKNLIIDKQFEEMLEVLKTFLLSLFCISKLYSGKGSGVSTTF